MASTADCAAWGVAGVSMLLTRAFKAASGTGALAATTFGCVTFGVATLGTVVFTVFVAPDTVLAALANEVPIPLVVPPMPAPIRGRPAVDGFGSGIFRDPPPEESSGGIRPP